MVGTQHLKAFVFYSQTPHGKNVTAVKQKTSVQCENYSFVPFIGDIKINSNNQWY